MHTDAWDESCDWPRRLLHVPSMTSHTWEPGNTYGGQPNPPYNALSYTWGRWALKDLDNSGIDSLRISGIPWQTPRVRPSHFTVEELLFTIKAASVEAGPFSTDFLWLDVACIDQRPNSREKASEIGRQGKIFKRAHKVYAWLTSFDTNSFDKWLSWSIEGLFIPYLHASRASIARGQVLATTDIPDSLLEKIDEHIQRLARDPWCTSLWTLQEGFLRPDAFPLLKTPPDPDRVFPDLQHSVDWIGHIIADTQRTGLSRNQKLRKIQKTALELGFIGAGHGLKREIQSHRPQVLGPTENPFHLLACSTSRKTSREEDRVYGIMQVFDFRLGKSAPEETRINFTIQELRQQLEDALVAKYPVASQLVIQPSDCRLGEAWMVQPGGVVSTCGEAFWRAVQDANTVKVLTKLSIRLFNDQRWGFFQGPVSSFYTLSQRFDVGVDLDQRWREEMLDTAGNGMAISEGRTEVVWPFQDRYIRSFPSVLELNNQHVRARATVYSWVNNRFPELEVALLGVTVMEILGDRLLATAHGICLEPLDRRISPASFQRIGTANFSFEIGCGSRAGDIAQENDIYVSSSVDEEIHKCMELGEGLFG
ncbi:hypothetical protein ASPVEDRAFT_42645 [Aspergillus versicolor CBS 583.65]|uniref:Heterokaryon incompatibility domain-containing protein n=1 Tax=Aspergillus versicolor CBS 583.65 TaxID=1036611 RepID=A0A1L9PNN3_ASPVE|nr:uncharacterized protein ASPVEDRAFT_42645 [Aspergillus versicolor CBS 583.65]OJJ03134.1 hypothetical protein ASPVEDRAFT_42645 [Aspergillus versicolor CBS 583.65]